MKKENLKRYIPILILFFVTLLVGFPLLRKELLDGDDAVFHLFRMFTTKNAKADGQFIPMVNPNMLEGFGYATNMFYGVLTTYIVRFLSLFIQPIGLCINLLILSILFLSGILMYYFIKEITEESKPALSGAIVYMTAPYFLFDIYIRMSIGEIACFLFLPILFHGLYNIIYGNQRKWYLLTIGTAGLFLSHSIGTLMAAIFAAIYVLLNLKKVWKKEIIKKVLFSLSFAILLSLPTILPLLEAKFSSDYMVFNSTYMKTTGERMISRSIHLLKSGNMIVRITQGYFVMFTLLFFIYIIFRKKRSLKKICIDGMILCAISLMLTLSIIPWNHLPKILSTFQFPWRFLQASSFFLALFFALLLESFFQEKNGKYIWGIIILCILISLPFIAAGIKNPGVDNQLVYSNKIEKRGSIARSTGTASAEYLPRNAIYNYQYLKSHDMKPRILKGNGMIQYAKKEGTHLDFSVQIEKDSIIELPYIYYPGYIIKANYKKVSSFETENGLLGIKLEKGNYKILSHYRGSVIMIISYGCFILGVILLSYIMVKEKGNNYEIMVKGQAECH